MAQVANLIRSKLPWTPEESTCLRPQGQCPCEISHGNRVGLIVSDLTFDRDPTVLEPLWASTHMYLPRHSGSSGRVRSRMSGEKLLRCATGL